jgi:hypothetical protein
VKLVHLVGLIIKKNSNDSVHDNRNSGNISEQ